MVGSQAVRPERLPEGEDEVLDVEVEVRRTDRETVHSLIACPYTDGQVAAISYKIKSPSGQLLHRYEGHLSLNISIDD